MISKKARNRKKVISFIMRLVTLIKPGSLSNFQIKIIRKLVSIASYRRPSVNKNVVEKIKLDKLNLYRIIPNKIIDKKKNLVFSWGWFFHWQFQYLSKLCIFFSGGSRQRNYIC